jgi:hypothetical protein
MSKQGIHQWLQSLPAPIPLAAAGDSPSATGLVALLHRYPEYQGTLTEALLWLRIGMIERPHLLVQEGDSALEKYLHGVVHRLEGDFWNANYWFRQVNDRRLLEAIQTEVDRQGARGEYDQVVVGRGEGRQVFQPQQLVAAVAAERQAGVGAARESAACTAVSQAEWDALWKSLHPTVAARNDG